MLLTPLVPQAAIVHIDVSHKRVNRNSIQSANIKGLRATPLAIILRSLWRPHSSDYKLQLLFVDYKINSSTYTIIKSLFRFLSLVFQLIISPIPFIFL